MTITEDLQIDQPEIEQESGAQNQAEQVQLGRNQNQFGLVGQMKLGQRLEHAEPSTFQSIAESSFGSAVEIAKPKLTEVPDLRKKFLEENGEFKVFLVNGEFIRSYLECDFTMGSHHYVSRFIPKDELWLDDRLSANDTKALIRHEAHEAKLMRKGMDYTKAHRLATRVEKRFRKKNFERNCKITMFF